MKQKRVALDLADLAHLDRAACSCTGVDEMKYALDPAECRCQSGRWCPFLEFPIRETFGPAFHRCAKLNKLLQEDTVRFKVERCKECKAKYTTVSTQVELS